MKQRIYKKRVRATLIRHAVSLGVAPRALQRLTIPELLALVGPFQWSPYPYFWVLEGSEPRPARSRLEFGRFFADPERRRIARDELGPTLFVSTVFLGMDHGFGFEPYEGPVLYETMIMGGGPDLNEAQWRYRTREEALEGHRHAVEQACAVLARRTGVS